MNNLINDAISQYKASGNGYYKTYTATVKTLIKSNFPLDSNEKKESFDKGMKRARAMLSQGIGAASKNGKAVVLVHYISKIEKDSSLNFSAREAHEVLKKVAGRSVDKNTLSGVFARNQEKNSKSPYFSSDEEGVKYRATVFSHQTIIELGEAAERYDKEKPKLTNPFQSQIDKLLEKYKN